MMLVYQESKKKDEISGKAAKEIGNLLNIEIKGKNDLDVSKILQKADSINNIYL